MEIISKNSIALRGEFLDMLVEILNILKMDEKRVKKHEIEDINIISKKKIFDNVLISECNQCKDNKYKESIERIKLIKKILSK